MTIDKDEATMKEDDNEWYRATAAGQIEEFCNAVNLLYEKEIKPHLKYLVNLLAAVLDAE